MIRTRRRVNAKPPAKLSTRTSQNLVAVAFGTEERLPIHELIINRRVPGRALVRIRRLVGLTKDELAFALGLPSARSLSAHERAGVRLAPAISEHLYRIARVADLTARVFGGRKAAYLWLRQPNLALAQWTPIALLSTEAGCGLVEQVVHSVEYGIYL